jgi:Ca-activated chloride channel homolog
MRVGIAAFAVLLLLCAGTPAIRVAGAWDANGNTVLAQQGTPLLPVAGSASEGQKRNAARVWPFFGADASKTEVAEDLLVKNIVLVYDGSGSMSEKKCSGNRTKIQVAREAVTEWIKTVPEQTNVGLVAFHGNAWSQLPLKSGDRSVILRRITAIEPGGTTPLTEAFGFAYQMLTEQAKRQLGYGEFMIVVVTDGIANDPTTLSARVRTILDQTPIILYSIGFCLDERHTLNQPGRTIYRTADNPETLRKGLQQVLAESESFDVRAFGK